MVPLCTMILVVVFGVSSLLFNVSSQQEKQMLPATASSTMGTTTMTMVALMAFVICRCSQGGHQSLALWLNVANDRDDHEDD